MTLQHPSRSSRLRGDTRLSSKALSAAFLSQRINCSGQVSVSRFPQARRGVMKNAGENKTVICAQKCKRQRHAQAVIRTWNALFTLWHTKSFPARLKKLSSLSAVFSHHYQAERVATTPLLLAHGIISGKSGERKVQKCSG